MMEDFTDIEGPLRLGIHPGFWIALGLALLGLAFFLYRRRHPRSVGKPAPVGPSPLERALERLDQLRQAGHSMEADPFVVDVSDVVREYLEDALQTRAREQTSEEFLQELQRKADLPEILRQTMPPFLTECDLVKFARQSIDESRRHELLDTAARVIEQTDISLRQALVQQKTEGGGR